MIDSRIAMSVTLGVVIVLGLAVIADDYRFQRNQLAEHNIEWCEMVADRVYSTYKDKGITWELRNLAKYNRLAIGEPESSRLSPEMRDLGWTVFHGTLIPPEPNDY